MKTLANAPIVAALAQINYETGRPVADTELNSFILPFKSSVPTEEINQYQFAPPAVPKMTRYGFQINNTTDGEVIQLTRDYFAFSRTSKYKDWDNFAGALKAKLVKFLSVSGAININRLALRYTNKIELPGEIGALKGFLKVYPELGEMVKNGPEILTLQVAMPISDIVGRSNVTFKIEKTSGDKWLLLLDIDVFMTGKYKATIDELIIEFSKLRTAKNRIFKETLTDAAISSFDK